MATVIAIVAFFMLKSFLPVPVFTNMDRAGIMLVGTLTFFLPRTLTVEDLETIPGNIILLFGGIFPLRHDSQPHIDGRAGDIRLPHLALDGDAGGGAEMK